MSQALKATAPDLKLLRQQLIANPADLELALQLANGLIGSGRPAEAVQLLTTRTRDPACRERLREYLAGEREHSLLQRLLANRIEDSVVAQVDSVVALHLSGDYKAAINLAQSIVRTHPQHAPAYNHLGRAQFNLGDARGARSAFEQAIRLRPEYPEAQHNLAQVLRVQPELVAAEQAFRRALALAPAYRSAWLHLGVTLIAADRLPDALGSFERLLQLNPDHPHALVNAGVCRQIIGDLSTARRYLSRAAQIDVRNPLVFEQLGDVLLEMGEHDAALAALRTSLELAPDQAGIWAGIAQAQLLAGRLADGENAIRHGLALAPDHPLLLLAAARLKRRAGQNTEALARLQQIRADLLPPRERAVLNYELGNCLEQDGQSSAAIAAFERANAAASNSPRARMVDFDALDPILDATEQWLARGAPMPAHETGEDGGADLCFVVGFPLSTDAGLQRLLQAHQFLCPISETSPLQQLRVELQALPGACPAALSSADRLTRDRLRLQYREQAAARINASPSTGNRRLLVDQDPLCGVDAALLHRLFPHAHFLLAVRHPCEAVLANFMQPSEADLFSVHFYTLEECARVFERVMRLWQRTRSVLPGMKVCVLRHENLISDPQGALQPVCEFLGVGWPASLREALAAPASAAGRPASLSNRRGPKWWERYRNELTAVLPLLKPVAEKLGYSLA